MKVPLGSPMFPCALWTPLSRQTLFFPPCQCQEPITEQWWGCNVGKQCKDKPSHCSSLLLLEKCPVVGLYFGLSCSRGRVFKLLPKYITLNLIHWKPSDPYFSRVKPGFNIFEVIDYNSQIGFEMFSEKKWLATVAQNVFKSSKKVAMSATLTPSTSTFKANECRDREEIKQKLSARFRFCSSHPHSSSQHWT